MKDYTYLTVIQNLKEHLFEFLISKDFTEFKDLPESERVQKINLYVTEHMQSIFDRWLKKVFDEKSQDPLALLFHELILTEFFYSDDLSEMLERVDSPL